MTRKFMGFTKGVQKNNKKVTFGAGIQIEKSPSLKPF